MPYGQAIYIFFSEDRLNWLIKGTANRPGASGCMVAKKKIIKKYQPIKTPYVQAKVNSFSFFSSVFQTKEKSDFIYAVNTSEILFSPKRFSKIHVRVIRKSGLYISFYDIN